MQRLLKICCGLDIHKDTIEACILKNNNDFQEPQIVRESFTTLRGDLFRLSEWLVDNDCTNVAMESTGVFWRPVYEVLENTKDMNLCLVNAHHMRNLPGRKTDVKDAQWIAELFMCGLLRASFVPDKSVRTLREYARFFKKFSEDRARHINRIEKFLQTHGFKLSSVLSDILSVSGRKILDTLAKEGSVSVVEVSKLIHSSVKKSPVEIAYAINGELDIASRLLLKQLLHTLNVLETELDSTFKLIQDVSTPFVDFLELIDSVPGVDILSATYILAEIGADMSMFKTDAHLSSWAGLSPRNDESAGTVKSKKILKGNSYVKSILCQCAWAAVRVRNAKLSNWFWANCKRLGNKKAIIAVARKLLVYIYHILKNKIPYDNEYSSIVCQEQQDLETEKILEKPVSENKETIKSEKSAKRTTKKTSVKNQKSPIIDNEVDVVRFDKNVLLQI